MSQVLLVSKPIVPPWHDSAKNLVRDLAAGGRRYRYHVMATRGAEPPGPAAAVEAIYPASGSYAPGLSQNLRTLLRLLRPDDLPIYHFFFSPNPKTSGMARLVLSLKRRKTVHTLCSVPRTFDGIASLMFADRVVALSRHTLSELERHGVGNAVHIPPCVPLTPPVSEERKARARARLGAGEGGTTVASALIVYPGDYEFSRGAHICAEALPAILENTSAHFVFACRVKTPAAKWVEAEVKARVEAMGAARAGARLGARVTFVNEVDDMEALVAASSLTVLPVDSLYAKMDIPLVLLESLREGVPLVVSDHGPLPELAENGAAATVPAGDADAFARTVVDLVGSPDKLAHMGAQGRSFVSSRFNPTAMAQAYETLYDKLLADV